MNFNELKTKFEAGQLVPEMNIEVKKYLPLVHKKLFADSVIEVCLVEDKGISKIDYLLKTLQMEINLVLNYTNIGLDDVEDTVSAYDFLKENGVIQYVYENISMLELAQIRDLIDKEIEQRLRTENSPAMILTKTFNELIDKFPKYDTKSFGRLIKSLSKEKPELLETFNKLLQQTN